MREIYSFKLDKKELVEEVIVSQDEKGNEIKTSKKVEKLVPHKYIIKKPSRSQGDDCELFRAATESDYIKKGVMSAALLEKRLLNDGDIYTEQQKKRYDELNKDFVTKKTEYDELTKAKDSERTEEQKKSLDDKIKELAEIIDEIQVLKNIGSNLYNRTAEVMARNRATLWLTLMLSFEEKDSKLIPVFGEGDFDKKLSCYDKFEEDEDEYTYSLIQTLSLIASVWYLGRATTKEDFDSLLLIKEESKEMSAV